MNKKDPTVVLNNNMEHLVDYLMCELKSLGKMNELSNSQLIEMERQFIARLAFAAIIGDEKEEDCESCPAKDHCSFKEPEKSDKKTVPDELWKALSFTHNYCKERDDCDGCMFSEHYQCKIKYTPNEWKV